VTIKSPDVESAAFLSQTRDVAPAGRIPIVDPLKVKVPECNYVPPDSHNPGGKFLKCKRFYEGFPDIKTQNAARNGLITEERYLDERYYDIDKGQLNTDIPNNQQP